MGVAFVSQRAQIIFTEKTCTVLKSIALGQRKKTKATKQTNEKITMHLLGLKCC